MKQLQFYRIKTKATNWTYTTHAHTEEHRASDKCDCLSNKIPRPVSIWTVHTHFHWPLMINTPKKYMQSETKACHAAIWLNFLSFFEVKMCFRKLSISLYRSHKRTNSYLPMRENWEILRFFRVGEVDKRNVCQENCEESKAEIKTNRNKVIIHFNPRQNQQNSLIRGAIFSFSYSIRLLLFRPHRLI